MQRVNSACYERLSSSVSFFARARVRVWGVCVWGVCERDKATASRALHTTVYGTSKTATLRIHSNELKNKMIVIL